MRLYGGYLVIYNGCYGCTGHSTPLWNSARWFFDSSKAQSLPLSAYLPHKSWRVRRSDNNQVSYIIVTTPPFAIVLSVATLVAFAFGRRRAQAGCCAFCNYNLTGNISGICPECGTPIPKETQEKLTTDLSKQ